MKKIYLILVILAALFTACNDTIIETIEGRTIHFDNVFVDQTTRATDVTINNLTNFYVHAWMSNFDDLTTCIFNAEEVIKSADGWTYGGGSRYWIAGKKYEFLAFSPINAQYTLDNTHTSFVYNNNGAKQQNCASAQYDLVVAKLDRVTAKNQLSNDDIQPVLLHFHHLLSRLVFNFVNDFTIPDVKLRIEDVRLTGIANSATFNFTTIDTLESPYSNSYVESIGSWYVSPETINHNGEAVDVLFHDAQMPTNSCTATAIEISTVGSQSADTAQNVDGVNVFHAVGNAISEQIYIIPEEIGYEQYRLAFKVTMYQGEEHPIQIGVFQHNVALNAMTFEAGKSYKFIAKFDHTNVNPNLELKPIEFTVSVTPWGEDVESDVCFPGE